MSQYQRSPTKYKSQPGLFKDGLWHCDCHLRPPAVKFQVKKEGKNHGRWFYTCQKQPPQKCGFFLWENDAEIRAKSVNLSNSRSEHDPRDSTPRTPSKSTQSQGGLLTPQTGHRDYYGTPPRPAQSSPRSARVAQMMAEDTGDYSDTEDSDEIAQLLLSTQAAEQYQSQSDVVYPELPNKVQRTPTTFSPGKRKLFAAHGSPNGREDLFSSTVIPTTSSSRPTLSSRVPPSSAELCVTPTPTKYHNVLSSTSVPHKSELAREATAIFEKHDVVLSNKALDELVELLNRHDLKLQGVNRGREITRLALKKKEEELSKKDDEIRYLHERITNLQAQRELDQKLLDSMSSGLS